jgi:hypothetical protein
MKFATFLLLALPSAEASRIFNMAPAVVDDTTSLVELSEGTDTAGKKDNVASDFSTLLKVWGLDLNKSWFNQGKKAKSSLWSYLESISSQIATIDTVIGMHSADHGGALVTLKDYIVTLRSEIKADIKANTKAVNKETNKAIK